MTTKARKKKDTLPCAGGCGADVPPPDTGGLDGFWAERLLAMPRWCDECEARDKAETEERVNRADRQRREQALELRLTRSTLPRRWWSLEFDPKARAAPVLAARRWAALEADPKGLLLWGDVGVGKTWLAATAASCLLRQRQVLWTSAPVLMARLGADFNTADREHGLAALLRADWPLALDDLDKASSRSDWAKQHLFAAIDERVAHDTPLLVTMNVHPGEIAERLGEPFGAAIASRLAGHCLTFEIGGTDRRTA